MSFRYQRYSNANANYYSTGYKKYNNNRNWVRSTGSAKPIDPRKYGDYTNKDEMVLSNSVRIVSWLGKRIICFFHAGVFYFGRKAIKLLENQAQFILPQLEYTANNYYTSPSDRYSFGIVPHVGDSEKMVCVGQDDAYWLIFNFLATNVLPVTFDEHDGLRFMDMFESPDNEAAFEGIFREVYEGVMANPFNPLNKEAVVGLITQLFDEQLLVVQPWEKDYRRNYRSWTEAIETGRQYQQPIQRESAQQQQNAQISTQLSQSE